MTYQLILLDLDGTLVDSSLGIVRSIQAGLVPFNLATTQQQLIQMIGPPVPEIYLTLYPEIFSNSAHLKKAIRHQRLYYATQGINESTLYPGVCELLHALKQSNKVLFIATSKPTVFAKKILQRLKLDHHFTGIIGSNLNLTRSKKTEIIAAILKKYKKILKEKIVMIGDRHHDIDAAHHHEIKSIGVTYGFGSKQEIITAKPSHIAHSTDNLVEILI